MMPCSAAKIQNDLARLSIKEGQKTLPILKNEGMLLVERGKPPLTIEAVGSKEPVDVTGAGDTVIAAYALGLASGLSYADAARVANHAGGIVVMKKGTASATIDELVISLSSDAASLISRQAT